MPGGACWAHTRVTSAKLLRAGRAGHAEKTELGLYRPLQPGPVSSIQLTCSWLLCRGRLVRHLMSVDGHINDFTPFHNVNCPQVRSDGPTVQCSVSQPRAAQHSAQVPALALRAWATMSSLPLLRPLHL